MCTQPPSKPTVHPWPCKQTKPCCGWCAGLRRHPQALSEQKEAIEGEIATLAAAAAKDLGLVLDKTLKLEWHKVANSRARCLRITQKEEKVVRSKLNSGR